LVHVMLQSEMLKEPLTPLCSMAFCCCFNMIPLVAVIESTRQLVAGIKQVASSHVTVPGPEKAWDAMPVGRTTRIQKVRRELSFMVWFGCW
jgi:hypothetical protein